MEYCDDVLKLLDVNIETIVLTSITADLIQNSDDMVMDAVKALECCEGTIKTVRSSYVQNWSPEYIKEHKAHIFSSLAGKRCDMTCSLLLHPAASQVITH